MHSHSLVVKIHDSCLYQVFAKCHENYTYRNKSRSCNKPQTIGHLVLPTSPFAHRFDSLPRFNSFFCLSQPKLNPAHNIPVLLTVKHFLTLSSNLLQTLPVRLKSRTVKTFSGLSSIPSQLTESRSSPVKACLISHEKPREIIVYLYMPSLRPHLDAEINQLVHQHFFVYSQATTTVRHLIVSIYLPWLTSTTSSVFLKSGWMKRFWILRSSMVVSYGGDNATLGRITARNVLIAVKSPIHVESTFSPNLFFAIVFILECLRKMKILLLFLVSISSSLGLCHLYEEFLDRLSDVLSVTPSPSP